MLKIIFKHISGVYTKNRWFCKKYLYVILRGNNSGNFLLWASARNYYAWSCNLYFVAIATSRSSLLNTKMLWRRRTYKDVCSKKYNLYVGKGPDTKEVLDSLTRLRESLKFDTNQKFMEWVVQTISSPQNEEPRNLTIINAKNSSHETVATPTEHC